MKHTPVLLKECIEGLNIQEDGIYVDATFGYGGHSKAMLEKLTTGKLVVFDQDVNAIEGANQLQKQNPDRVEVVFDNYANIKGRLFELDIERVDGILIDCGVSSMQLDEAKRGFSYRYDAPLDMRMNQTQKLRAKDVVNTYSEKQLQDVLFSYGEEKFAKRIVREILAARTEKEIETTFELVNLIKKGYPMKALSKPGHPAKQTFQAIRIEVNNELQSLKKMVEDGCELLAPQGRMAVITFHSLEDRIVKNVFASLSKPPKVNKRIPMKEVHLHYTLINNKVILPTQEELDANPRSASAKLRIIERK